MSRILGAAFVALVVATIGLIGWQLAATAPVAPAPITDAPAAAVETQEPGAAESAFAAPVTEAPARRAESASDFGGELRDGVDPALPVGPGQGVLQLDGPAEVTARVDGIDRGALPISLVLDEGRHVVRYEHAGRRSVRFYFVRAGATRVLEVITRPGGFVDAR